MGPAMKLGRRMVELWNADDLDAIYETVMDRDIVVRPDPDFPEGPMLGKEAAVRFWEGQREAMGLGQIKVEEEHDLGDSCLIRVHQPVHSRSGIESGYSWSMIITAREGRAIMIEFFIDADRGRRAVGLD